MYTINCTEHYSLAQAVRHFVDQDLECLDDYAISRLTPDECVNALEDWLAEPVLVGLSRDVEGLYSVEEGKRWQATDGTLHTESGADYCDWWRAVLIVDRATLTDAFSEAIDDAKLRLVHAD